MRRDDELKRLVKYAEGMGLKVKFSSAAVVKDAAEWAIDGSEIVIFTRNNDSKTEILLSMIHEIGHHVWFIHEKNRQPDLTFEKAIDRQNLFDEDLSDTPPPKKMRKKILDIEVAGTQYWEMIYKDTNMQFPIWKMYAAMEFDIWVYQNYFKTGHFPKNKEARAKFKEVRAKHKPMK